MEKVRGEESKLLLPTGQTQAHGCYGRETSRRAPGRAPAARASGGRALPGLPAVIACWEAQAALDDVAATFAAGKVYASVDA